MNERKCKVKGCGRLLEAGEGSYCPFHETERARKRAAWVSAVSIVAGIVAAAVFKKPWIPKG
jgi:hypothetical protein